MKPTFTLRRGLIAASVSALALCGMAGQALAQAKIPMRISTPAVPDDWHARMWTVFKESLEAGAPGEMQVQIALDAVLRKALWPQSGLQADANVFVFPNLSASNVAYQMLSRLGGVDEIGPILLGLKHPATVIPPGCGVETIVQMTAVTALHAQRGGD